MLAEIKVIVTDNSKFPAPQSVHLMYDAPQQSHDFAEHLIKTQLSKELLKKAPMARIYKPTKKEQLHPKQSSLFTFDTLLTSPLRKVFLKKAKDSSEAIVTMK